MQNYLEISNGWRKIAIPVNTPYIMFNSCTREIYDTSDIWI